MSLLALEDVPMLATARLVMTLAGNNPAACISMRAKLKRSPRQSSLRSRVKTTNADFQRTFQRYLAAEKNTLRKGHGGRLQDDILARGRASAFCQFRIRLVHARPVRLRVKAVRGINRAQACNAARGPGILARLSGLCANDGGNLTRTKGSNCQF